MMQYKTTKEVKKMIAANKYGVESAKKIANYFIELASKEDENDLTNLKLQKLLYIAQGLYLAKNKKPFDALLKPHIRDDVQAWRESNPQ
jgi:uncharacterized phage-associated protein